MTDRPAFEWPCERRDAHAPHEVPTRDPAEHRRVHTARRPCPGVPAHPSTMIGGGHAETRPPVTGWYVGPTGASSNLPDAGSWWQVSHPRLGSDDPVQRREWLGTEWGEWEVVR